jgi:uncharacterized protein YceK
MSVLVLVLMTTILSGCKTKMEQALEQAKKQAAATGQAQQVVVVDNKGVTTTTVVQPPVSGQPPVISTNTTQPEAGAPLPPPSGPTVSTVPQMATTMEPLPVPEPIPAPDQMQSSGQMQPSGQMPPSRQGMAYGMSIPADTTLVIRTDQSISVKNSREGDRFSGEVVEKVLARDNRVLVPRGAQVSGVVDVVHRKGFFKGESVIGLRLTRITLNGVHYTIFTNEQERGGEGAGGHDRSLNIPAESILHFKLASKLVLK